MAAVKKLQDSIPHHNAFEREYLLKLVPDAEQIIHREWIQYYETLPLRSHYVRYRTTAIGVDPATSSSPTANFTAMVCADLHGYGEQMKIYILPHSINERMDMDESLMKAKWLSENVVESRRSPLYVEETAVSKGLIQGLKRARCRVEGIIPHGSKTDRLQSISYLIKNGTVLFPQTGAEQLISQLVNFGVEKYDDLADAFYILVDSLMNNFKGGAIGVGVLDWNSAPSSMAEGATREQMLERYRGLEQLRRDGWLDL